MIKYVFFDLDNTVYDYVSADMKGREAVFDYVKGLADIDASEFDKMAFEGMHLLEERLGMNSASIHNRVLRYQYVLETLGIPVVEHAAKMAEIYWGTLIDHARMADGLVAFIEILKKEQIGVGIGTNMTAYVQYKKLEELKLGSWIDLLVTSEEAGVEKPDRKFFELCIEKAGCLAEECLFIGDNWHHDMEGAMGAGMQAAWYQEFIPKKETELVPVISCFRDCIHDGRLHIPGLCFEYLSN